MSYMDRNRRHSRNRGRSWNEMRGGQEQKPKFRRSIVPVETRQEIAAKEKAIKDFKAREVICPMCGQPITDVSSAIADKATGTPAHFDCVLGEISKNEKVKANERLTYIGQGRFAVLSFENPRDMRHFKIERIIEWEERNKSFDWRTEMAGLYSQVKQI